jgi:thiamine biosynthesis lipoprotein
MAMRTRDRYRWMIFCAILSVGIGLAVITSCSHKPPAFITGTTHSMGTVVNVTIYPAGADADPDQLYLQAVQAIEEVASHAAGFRQGSELYNLNQSAGDTQGFVISPILLDLLLKSQEAYRLTSGAFDPTVAPLVSAYDFGYDKSTGKKGTPHPLTPQQISALLPLVGFDKVSVDKAESRVYLPSGMSIDLGAIAKGYAADLACQRVAENASGIMVEIGGDIAIRGHKPDGEPWRVAIADPRHPQQTLAELLLTGDCGVATSGDYENYFEVNGIRLSHIIDPRTGLPAQYMVSVTVVAPTGALADALATGIFVLGVDGGLNLAENLPGVEVLIYTEEEGTLVAHCSSGFERFLAGDENRE